MLKKFSTSLLLYLCCSGFISYAQTSKEDSLRALLNKTDKQSEKINLLIELSERIIFIDSTESHAVINELVLLAKKEKNYIGLVKAFVNYTQFMILNNRPDLAIKFIDESTKNIELPSLYKAKIQNLIAACYFKQDDIAKSREYYLKTKHLSEIKGFEEPLLVANVNLGVVNDYLGNYPKAIDYYFNGMNSPAANFKTKVDLLINLSTCYNEMNQVNLAIKYGWQGLHLLEEIGVERDKLSEVTCKSNLAEFYLKSNKLDSAKILIESSLQIAAEISDHIGIAYGEMILGNIYYKQSNYKLALPHLEKAVIVAKKINDTEALIVTQKSLAKIMLKRERYIEAIQSARNSMRLAKSINLNVEIRDNHLLLSEIFESIKNLDSSLYHFKQYSKLNDSIFNKKKTNQIAMIRAGFELEKKEQEIENLSQEASIQTLQLKQYNLYLIIIGIALLVLILLSAFYYFYNKQRRFLMEQKAQLTEQKLLRVQMNPHFIFNALSSVQEYMIDGDSKSASKYLSNFSKLMRQVLESSRKDFIPLDEEIEILENYLVIQNLRRDTPFTYSIYVDESVDKEELQIPPMFAQPFIENAIEHGISGIKDEAHINIQFHLIKDQLHLKITDNGIGVEQTLQSKNSGHTSLATQITQERISIFKRLLNKEIAFDISSGDDNKGTSVLLKLPFSYS